jgi:hypothetical protein
MFLQTGRRNGECIVCGDLKGKCRKTEDDNVHLCMNTHEQVGGDLYFIGDTNCGLWGKFVFKDLNFEDGIKARQERKEKLEKAKVERERLKRLQFSKAQTRA